jgi:death-on-curing family protein
MKQQIIIFDSPDGDIKLDVRFNPKEETVCISLKQLSELFQRDKSVISRHLKSIFENNELEKSSVVAKYATTSADKKTYNVEYYNLDAILAVGYRINSKRGIQFRKWASQILKKHLLKGYTLNKNKLFHSTIVDFERSLNLVSRALSYSKAPTDLGLEAINIIKAYAKSWEILISYDEGTLLKPEKETLNPKPLSYTEEIEHIKKLKESLAKRGQAGRFFGLERDESFKAILGNIEQTFDGVSLYPSVEERAAHLFYFTIKDHPFSDGNKRIGCFLFLMFLKLNDILQPSTLNDMTLVTLALLIAESKAEEKELMIKLIQNLICNNRGTLC